MDPPPPPPPPQPDLPIVPSSIWSISQYLLPVVSKEDLLPQYIPRITRRFPEIRESREVGTEAGRQVCEHGFHDYYHYDRLGPAYV
jgi:hypothetical protein